MSRPVAGQKYTIVKGDTLWDIAAVAYGSGPKYTIIWDANKSNLKSGNPDLIYPGEILWLPIDGEREQVAPEPVINDADPGDFTIIIDGTPFPAESANLLRTFDTAADGWTATVYYDPEDILHQKYFKPFAYPRAQVLLGGVLKCTGIIYDVDLALVEEKSVATLHGFTLTKNIVDSNAESPFQVSNVSLEKRTKDLIAPYGIALLFEPVDDPKYKRVKIDKTEKIFDHINKLARQRQWIVGCTAKGELLIHEADLDKTPIGVIREGEAVGREYSGSFKGSQRFSKYKAYSSGPRSNKSATATDDAVPFTRMLTMTANDTEDGTIKEAAEARAKQSLADALSIPVPVGNWYTPDGKLYEPGELVTYVSPTLFLPDGYDFLIKEVTYNFTDNDKTAILKLVPPGVYSKDELVDPWA